MSLFVELVRVTLQILSSWCNSLASICLLNKSQSRVDPRVEACFLSERSCADKTDRRPSCTPDVADGPGPSLEAVASSRF